MELEKFIAAGEPIAYKDAKSRVALAIEVQNKLTELGLLDPSITGSESNPFGPEAAHSDPPDKNTLFALDHFGQITHIPLGGAFTVELAERLLQSNRDNFLPLVLDEFASDSAETILAKRILRYLQGKGYWIARSPEMLNIVYIEGADADGRKNKDEDNQFNDRRILIRVGSGGIPEIVHNVSATTEPSIEFAQTDTAKGRKGAARIAFGQYKAWKMGFHQQRTHGLNHPALTQSGLLRIHRDLNADGSRSGDKVYIGTGFGVNQHSTRQSETRFSRVSSFSARRGRVSSWSEGCLVGQVWEEHGEFLRMLQKDIRYVQNKDYIFMSAVLNGDDFSDTMMGTRGVPA
ncbi:MAG: hypothetical protein IPK76_22500 [Lewinellaceae bacterium]|jgi:hypothetical protein|nr:hypothetical protein [Lewinellaceae bacterium]